MIDKTKAHGATRVYVSPTFHKSLFVLGDGSILDDGGRLLFVSLDRFITDIAQGECCFVCGEKPGQMPFTDEHVIPNWILRDRKLHSETIGLVNDHRHRYGSYVVPCCHACNASLGRLMEGPVRTAFASGGEGFAKYCRSDRGALKVFAWMALLFVKAHLKDKVNPIDPTTASNNDGTLGALVPWPELHHAYCVARAIFGNIGMEREAMGSLIVLPVRTDEPGAQFDFCDLTEAQTVMIRIGSIVVIAVLNDSSAAASMLADWLPKLRPLSIIQCRELVAHAAYINLQLEERPRFSTAMDEDTLDLYITVKRPAQLRLRKDNADLRGALMARSWQSVIDGLVEGQKTEYLNAARSGNQSTLWNADGSFNDKHYIRMES